MIPVAKCIEEIEDILATLVEDPSLLEKLQMHHAFDCILFRMHGDFEGAIESVFDITDILNGTSAVESVEDPQYLVLSLFGLHQDVSQIIPGFIEYEHTEYNDDQFVPNALTVLNLLKGLL